MVIQEKLATYYHFLLTIGTIDWFTLEWYETNKRILHKKTSVGQRDNR